ncbi:HD domain-containing protein [Chryseolinea lacunae]|uniref:HD domain-containing protein n=1 Tax=Chryseolinea lacunae TaxID=2801331 RepID=A0ABS1KK07_9BACT|nr:HD domain-containing protein [Chryseolinea lacunae]MBL0739795.1 HD domain-containing protein [Chryseolinea lacunae]
MQDLNPYDSELLNRVEAYVKELLNTKLPPTRVFHTLPHTVNVVRACCSLIAHYATSQANGEALLTAAWFHDTGYTETGVKHEEEGVKIALRFLRDFNLPQEFYLKIEGLIIATKLSASPKSLLEEMLCDADLSHLGSEEYEMWSLRLKQEFERQLNKVITLENWNQQNIFFFKNHAYYTTYAQQQWGPVKENNLMMLLKSI